MKIGIMQPYFMPYIGYFQLIQNVDIFVIHDDVQYIKNGWINRNRILMNNEPAWLTLPVVKSNYDAKIKDKIFIDDIASIKLKILRRIRAAYSRAPYFDNTFNEFAKILNNNDMHVSTYICDSIKTLCNYMGITTPIILASSFTCSGQQSGENKVISICKELGANEYVNPIGGTSLYSFASFNASGIKLSFIESLEITYQQFDNMFEPSLSIIDVLMFNTIEEIRLMLDMIRLIG